ncbi:hypothetical protein [Streptomyces sp. S186]
MHDLDEVAAGDDTSYGTHDQGAAAGDCTLDVDCYGMTNGALCGL